MKVNQGLVVPIGASKEGRPQKGSVQVAANSEGQVQEPQSFESITSYRFDYVSHPVQPRTRRGKPGYQRNTGLSEPVASLRPTVSWDVHQELVDEAREVVQHFKTWSLETKFQGQVQTKESSLPKHHKFLSTTTCQHSKPALPSIQTSEKNKKPLQVTTAMEAGCKAWDTPQRFPTVHK